MKNKILMLITSLMVVANLYAAEEGSIDLSLTVNKLPELEIIFAGNENINLDITEDSAGDYVDMTIGGLTLTGKNIDNNIACTLEISSLHPEYNTTGGDVGFYLLINGSDANSIRYNLRGSVYFNDKTTAGINDYKFGPNSGQPRAFPIGNSCKINIPELRVVIPSEELLNKDGTYTDTITYKISAS